MNKLFLFFHIPRTGGTFFTNSISNYLDRKDDHYLKHFNYVQGVSENVYSDHLIPFLRDRTTEQQKLLRTLTGHSIISASTQWLRVTKVPHYFTIVRDPVKRLLSSFNMRYNRQLLMQNKKEFSLTSPCLSQKAIYQEKTAEDYDNLYEFYQDAIFEHNIQVKWLIKSFYVYENCKWQKFPDYMVGPDSNLPTAEHYAITWPQWMYAYDPAIDYWYILESFLNEFWYIETTENLSANMPALAKEMQLDYAPPISYKDTIQQYWTYDDVINQPYFDKLCNALNDDYKLYKYALNLPKPWNKQ